MFYSFGDFELSEQEFSLSRHGKRIALEPRALRVLLLLVQNQGKLLSKTFILESVWQNTFVEETTLTRIIAILRKQLEDDPRAPKFIETVPTRGYRFIAAVHEVHAPEAELATASNDTPSALADSPALQPLPTEDPPPAPSSISRFQRRPLLYGAALLCICIAAPLFLKWHRAKTAASLSTRDTLVLADFVNRGDDLVFDDALRQGMLVQLEQSPVLRLASDGQIRRTLKLMGLPENTTITSEVGREICQRIGGTVLLDGSISRLGSEYLLGLRARRCSTGEHLDAEQMQVARKEDVLTALSQIATRFRTRLGEERTSIEGLDRPLEEATTPSLDALKAYSEALRLFNNRGSLAALPLFQRASELDSHFAMAHALLGRMYADLGQDALAASSTRTAYTLRDRTSERERFFIDVSYDVLVSGDLEKAKVSSEAWEQMYPRDIYPRNFLAGVIYPAYGQYDRALQEANASIDLDPDFVLGYRNAASNLISLDRPAEAAQVLQHARQRGLFLPSFHTDAYRLAFLQGDAEGMRRAAEATPTNPWLLSYQAATLARSGRLAEARRLQEEAVRLAQHGAKQETQARLMTVAAFTEALYGYPQNAARLVHGASQLSESKEIGYESAFVLALIGQPGEAEAIGNELGRRFPEDTLVRRVYLPTIQAAVAVARKQPQHAIDLLRATTPFDLAQPLHHHCVRAHALMALGQPGQAAVELHKIADHRGLVLNDPLGNIVNVDLARSYASAGRLKEAQAVYDDVLRRWEGADASLPIRQQVQKERLALQ